MLHLLRNISRGDGLDPALMGACNRIEGRVPREVGESKSRFQLNVSGLNASGLSVSMKEKCTKEPEK